MKRTITKFLAAILSISLCLQSGFTVFGTDTATAAVDYSEEVSLLKTLGIVDVSFDGSSFDTSKPVKRAEFAQYIMKLMNFDAVTDDTLYYNDVSKNHYAYDEITTLTKYGYFSGVREKEFEPGTAILKDHAFMVFLKLIGLGKVMAAKNYDVSYVYAMCKKTGLLEGVSDSSSVLTQGTLIKMLYNALDAQCYGEEFSSETIIANDENLLYTTRKMLEVKNVQVTAVKGTDINGNGADEDHIIIGGKKFLMPDFEVYKYLGRYVNYIYKVPGRDSLYDGELVRITESGSSDVIEISVDRECSFSKTSGELKYYVNDRDKTVIIPKGITLIYNGKRLGTGVFDIFAHEKYELTLLKDSSGEYDIAIVWEYTNFVVESVNSKEMTATEAVSGQKLNLNAEDYDILYIVDAAGAASSFDKIKKDNVLAVYMSADKKRAKVCIVDAKVSGTVESVSKNIVTVSGKKYEFYDEDVNASTYLSKNVTLLTDIGGFIVYCRVESGGTGTVGYLYQAGVETEAFSEALLLKVLNEDGNIYTYEAVNNVRINGERKTATAAFKILSGGASTVTPQLISYAVNSDSKVTRIDTAYDELTNGKDGEDHALTVNTRVEPYADGETDYEYAYHTVSSKRIGRKLIMNGDTKVFIVPEDTAVSSSSDRLFKVGKLDEGRYGNAVAYRTTAEPTFYEQYVVVKQSGASASSSIDKTRGVMVDEIYKTLEEDGDIGSILRIVDASGTFTELTIDSEECDINSLDLKRGDVIKYLKSSLTGLVTAIRVSYKRDTKEFKDTDDGITGEFRIFPAYVNSAYPEGIKLGYADGSSVDEVLGCAISGFTTVVVYDEETDEITVGNYTDLKTYKADGDKCSFMIAQSRWLNPVGMFGFNYK